MDGQGLYVHHNGMWFDGGRTLVPPPIPWQHFSFTIDVWFKFYDAVGGRLVDTTSPAPRSFNMYTQAPNVAGFTLNGIDFQITYTFVAPIDYNKWFILQAAVARQTLTDSKV